MSQFNGHVTLLGRMGFKGRRVLLVATGVVVFVTGLVYILASDSESALNNPPRPRVLAVQTTSLKRASSYQTQREYTGAIVASRTSQLGFELAGKLERIYVDEGDSIAVGSALAQLDIERLQTKRRQLVARRAQAAAKLDEMVTGPRDEDIAAARARVESLQAQVKLLRLQTARQKRLLAQNTTSQDEYEQYAFGLAARQSQLQEARHHLDELLNGVRKERIEAQKAVVGELDAAIADVDVDLRKSTLKAPFDGKIARRLADEGAVVEAGASIFRLVEDQVLEARIGLPVRAAERLAAQSPQRVKIGGVFFGAIVSGRFPEVDPATRTRTVILRLDDSAAQQVVQGQVVRLHLEESVPASGFWLPSTALAKGARGLWTCLVVVEANPKDPTPQDFLRVERRHVEVLHTESDRVFVRGTLNSGDRVITSGTHRVAVGQLVRLAK